VIALLLSAVLTSGPCAEPALTAARLAAAQSEADFARELTDVETGTGATLLQLDELARPLPERTALAAARSGTACAWRARDPRAAPDRSAALRGVLDRPDFRGARDRAPHAAGQLWDRMKAWVMSLLEDRTTRSLASGVRWLVLALSATIAGVGLWHSWRRRRAQTVSGPGRPGAVLSRRVPAPDHLRTAHSLLPAAPRASLREALLGLLAALEQAGWLASARALTNRELAGAVLPRTDGAEVSELLRGFDRRYYSLEAVTPEDAAHYLHSVEASCARLVREEAP